MNSIRDFFMQLPNEDTHEFDSQITQYVNFTNLDDKVEDIMQLLTGDESEKIRYSAFYCLILYYRNEKNISAINNIFNNHRDEFCSHSTYQHLELVSKLKMRQFENHNGMINDSYKLSKIHKSNAGIIHLFADVVVTLMENELLTDDGERWMLLALEASNRAIFLDDRYAKYYATKARLLLYSNDFENALKNIETAINTETPKRYDYTQKINDYNYYRYNIMMKREQSQIDKKVVEQKHMYEELNEKYKKIDERINSTMIKNLEILGFFTAIISFTIGSLELAKGQTGMDAARLIVILSGCLIFVYSCFTLLLQSMASNKLRKRNITMAIISFVFIGGLLFWMSVSK